jgi:hypothetical protein
MHDDAPNREDMVIPRGAAFVIVGDTIITEPYGSALLFSKTVDSYKRG